MARVIALLARLSCHLSSEVEQGFRKAKVLGSNPRGGSGKLSGQGLS